MVQAHARELLNQKESQNEALVEAPVQDALFAATERLMLALDKLESRVQDRASQQAKQAEEQEKAAFYARENEALKREREGLNATISKLEGEYNDLEKAAGTIYNKLNDSIRRLTNIIGD